MRANNMNVFVFVYENRIMTPGEIFLKREKQDLGEHWIG
jgi:hypothetical protein